eukprot:1182511-Prorocentrum_minimum.AAC.3
MNPVALPFADLAGRGHAFDHPDAGVGSERDQLHRAGAGAVLVCICHPRGAALLREDVLLLRPLPRP